jgi:hypothetical protein
MHRYARRWQSRVSGGASNERKSGAWRPRARPSSVRRRARAGRGRSTTRCVLQEDNLAQNGGCHPWWLASGAALGFAVLADLGGSLCRLAAGSAAPRKASCGTPDQRDRFVRTRSPPAAPSRHTGERSMRHISHPNRANEQRGRSTGSQPYSELQDDHQLREERRKAEQDSVLLLQALVDAHVPNGRPDLPPRAGRYR